MQRFFERFFGVGEFDTEERRRRADFLVEAFIGFLACGLALSLIVAAL